MISFHIKHTLHIIYHLREDFNIKPKLINLKYKLDFSGLAIAFALVALIFRNLDIILHTISGRYEKAESTSPFQKDVVKRVKKIGILSIAIPVFSFALTAIVYVVSLINGTPVDVSVSLEGVVIGLVCLCLTQIFSYGAQLEEEVDGLL